MTEHMRRDIYDVDKIVVGTVGEVGNRTFFIQVVSAGDVVTVKLEKQQVAALSEMLGEMLRARLPAEGSPEQAGLIEPIEPAFVVGTIGIHFDEDSDRVLLLIEELVAEKADEESRSVLRVVVTREQAVALAIHGAELVASGRPLCPICGLPLDQRGHVCPRGNGKSAPVR
jgi:uncharacterized repeat protein (TIGR03847 family)